MGSTRRSGWRQIAEMTRCAAAAEEEGEEKGEEEEAEEEEAAGTVAGTEESAGERKRPRVARSLEGGSGRKCQGGTG